MKLILRFPTDLTSRFRGREAVWERGGMERRGSKKEGMGTAGYGQVVDEGCKALREAHTSWPLCTEEEGWEHGMAAIRGWMHRGRRHIPALEG